MSEQTVQADLQGPVLETGLVGKAGAAEAASRGWRRWLQPSLFDVLLTAIPFWFFSLADGGLGLVLLLHPALLTRPLVSAALLFAALALTALIAALTASRSRPSRTPVP